MKQILLIIVIFLQLFSCTSVNYAQSIPSSKRSSSVIERIRPKLEKEFTQGNLKLGSPIYIRVFKSEMELEMWIQFKGRFELFKTYKISTYGGKGLGPKIKQGDGRAPEGFYFVKPVNLNPFSEFHLSFNIGYPNSYDRFHGRTGSAIMVHGSFVSIGCYAMTDKNIEEIYTLADAALRRGQDFFRIHIFPFRMTEDNMDSHKKSVWIDFWNNLKEGYDYFETYNHNPPNVEIKNGRYVFNEN